MTTTNINSFSSCSYSLNEIYSIINDGFDYKLNPQVISTLNDLMYKISENTKVNGLLQIYEPNIKNKRNDNMNIKNKEKITLTPFKKIDLYGELRINLNKLTDKNYLDIQNKIFEIIENLLQNSIQPIEIVNKNDEIIKEKWNKIYLLIVEIITKTSFYSKIYVDLYSNLCLKYENLRQLTVKGFEHFMISLEEIEKTIYVDPNKNYDEYCEQNKLMESRKSKSHFYLNLMNNNIITENNIKTLIYNILNKILLLINIENKKNEVDEFTELFSILYKTKKTLYEKDKHFINNKSIKEIITILVNSNKIYKSLSKKSVFKFMDLLE